MIYVPARNKDKNEGEKSNVQTLKAANNLVEGRENKNPNLYIPEKAMSKTRSRNLMEMH